MTTNQMDTLQAQAKELQAQMQELLNQIARESVIPTNRKSKKETVKMTAKNATKTGAGKLSPVGKAITEHQAKLQAMFAGASYGVEKTAGFHVMYRRDKTGGYVKLGHFNVSKKLFWFTKKNLRVGDWSDIRKFVTPYASKLDLDKKRIHEAGIKNISDFRAITWSRFYTTGAFC